jgi:phage N-6-adenine-methyltransferase
MPAQKPGKSEQAVGTPPEFLVAVRTALSIKQFDIDLAATHQNRVCPYYFAPPDTNFFVAGHRGNDAFAHPWKQGNGWNWLNPPYTNIEPWVARGRQQWLDHMARTAILVPASVGSNWFRDHVHRKATVWFLNGRLTFVGHPTCYPKDLMLVLYGRAGLHGNWIWDWKRQKFS